MDKARQGCIALIAAYVLLIGTDVALKYLWFQRFGFIENKLGSIIVGFILFYFAFRGSGIARWLTVLIGLGGVVLGFVWGIHEFGLGILLLATTSLSTILLILPSVTVFQRTSKSEFGRTQTE